MIAAIGCLATLATLAVAKRLVAHPARHGMLTVSGRLDTPLYPGRFEAVELRLHNRYPFGLRIMRIDVGVRVDRAHRRLGCRPRRDFFVWQIPLSEYPVRIRARQSATLRELGVGSVPIVTMRNLRTVNQDGCQGATLQLRYRARAVRDTAGGEAVRP